MPAGCDQQARPWWPAALRWTVACAAVLILASGPLWPAAAAAPPAPPRQGLSVHPALSGETTLPGGHFTYALPPGGTFGDALVVESSEPAAARVAVYGADLLTIAGGGVTPAAAGQTMHGVGNWLTVAPVAAPVPAGGRLRVPFTLAVPSGTAPGTYDGAVVTEARVGATPAGVPVGVRIALIVHVLVVAGAVPALTLGPVAVAGAAGPETLAVTLRNGGNVNLGVAGTIAIRNSAGAEVGRVPLGPAGLYLVPGGTAVLRGAFVWPRGLRRAAATPVIATTVGVQPGPTYSGPSQVLTRPGGSAWAVGVAAAAAAVAAVWFITRDHPRRRLRR